MPTPLPDDAIERELTTIPAWTRDEHEIVRSFDRGDFNGALAFINAIGAAANAADHHPDLALSWGDVMVRLSSHDAGGLTERDFALARTIDALAAGAASA
jgi:4a-hydroxytetrahydrobiopterin dehydratase